MPSGANNKKISVEEYKGRKASKGASKEPNPPQQGESPSSSHPGKSSHYGKSSHHGNSSPHGISSPSGDKSSQPGIGSQSDGDESQPTPPRTPGSPERPDGTPQKSPLKDLDPPPGDSDLRERESGKEDIQEPKQDKSYSKRYESDSELEENRFDRLKASKLNRKKHVGKSPKKAKKTKKPNKSPKQKRKRKQSTSSSSSSSGSSSSESDPDTSPERQTTKKHNKKLKVKRFSFQRKEKALHEDLAHMLNSDEHFKDADLEKGILGDHPVPTNITPVRKLDEFIKMEIEATASKNPNDPIAKGLKFDLMRDKQLSHIEKKVRDIIGPLSSLLNKTIDASEGKRININDLTQLTDKISILVNQAVNQVVYQRRKQVITAMKRSESGARSLLEDNREEVKRSRTAGLLFGKTFEKLWKKQSGRKTSLIELPKRANPPFPSTQVSNNNRGGGAWEHKNPPHQQHAYTKAASNIPFRKQGNQNAHGGKGNSSSSFNKGKRPTYVNFTYLYCPQNRVEKHTPLHPKIIPITPKSTPRTIRENHHTRHQGTQLGKVNKQTKNSGGNNRPRHKVQSSTFTTHRTKGIQTRQSKTSSTRHRNKPDGEKRGHCKSKRTEGTIHFSGLSQGGNGGGGK